MNLMNTNKDGIQLDITENTPPAVEEKSNVVPLTVIGGGKGGDHPWLLDRPVGSNFLCKSNKSEVDLFEYWILGKTLSNRSFKIVLVKQDAEVHYWVDPIEFSKVMHLHEIISD